MPLFPFGPWRPDLTDIAQLDETGAFRLTEAINALPELGCYQPAADAAAVTDALVAACQGIFACTDANNNVNWFAGTASNISRISSNTASWSFVGSGYALSSEGRWSFTRYGNEVFAAAPTESFQYMTMSAGSTFSDVQGDPPRPRHIAVVKNFMVAVGTANNPQRVQWSALNNPHSWTIDATTLADFQDLLGPGGQNQGIIVGLAGADAVILQERAVWRMLYVGQPLLFQFDPVENMRGALAAGSIVQSAGFAFYYSEDGFYQFDGTTSKPIGLGKIDNWFSKDVDDGAIDRITAVADPERSLVFWSYKSVSGSAPDRILVYNWQISEWSLIQQDCELIWSALQRHSLPFGIPRVACVTTNHQAALFFGGTKAATLTTAQYQLNPAGRTLITEIYPLSDKGTAQAEILHRSTPFDALLSSSAVPRNAQGFGPFRIDDRLMALRSIFDAGVDWAKFRGVKTNPKPTGTR